MVLQGPQVLLALAWPERRALTALGTELSDKAGAEVQAVSASLVVLPVTREQREAGVRTILAICRSTDLDIHQLLIQQVVLQTSFREGRRVPRRRR